MSPQTQGTPQDEQAIRTLATQFTAAWNKSDTKALAACFTNDGDVINPAGRIARGQSEVEKLLRDEHAGPFKGTHLRLSTTHVRFLKPDIAVADHEHEISGIQGPQSTLKGLVTFLVRKDGGHWLITSARPMVPAKLPA